MRQAPLKPSQIATSLLQGNTARFNELTPALDLEFDQLAEGLGRVFCRRQAVGG